MVKKIKEVWERYIEDHISLGPALLHIILRVCLLPAGKLVTQNLKGILHITIQNDSQSKGPIQKHKFYAIINQK